MDSKFFRIPTQPNYYQDLESAPPVDVRRMGTDQEFPAPDSRFPGWPAPMSDARLVTDYQPHCAKNIPAGKQFPTKHWMQNNATGVIEYNRRLFADRMGATQPFDNSVVPPPAQIVTCEKGECSIKNTDAPGGIGLARAEAAVPELFGTFSYVSAGAQPLKAAQVPLTRKQEGGRNSVRGVF